MHLSPKEINKLMLHNAGFLAQKRYARGLRLNYVETMALLSSQILEFIRDGDSVALLMEKGKRILGFADVMPGIDSMIDEVQVEGTFPDGTKLVTIHQPISSEQGEEELALYGSGLSRSSKPKVLPDEEVSVPGEVLTQNTELLLNEGRETITLSVLNRGDRPVQVGSHYPFFETNPLLEFDREKSFGMRLDIPAGTAVRFEPGESKSVSLVSISGNNLVFGGNGLIDGELNDANKTKSMEKIKMSGFGNSVR